MTIAGVRGLMQPEEVDTLARLAGRVPPWATIVELGTHTGLSTVAMANAARRGKRAHVVAVDPYPEPRPGSRDDPYGLGAEGVLDEFRGNLTRLGLWPYVTPLRGYSLDVAKLWHAPVGLLFVDSVHERDAVEADYRAWSPYLIRGGWLAFHDYDATDYPGVIEAVEEVVLPTGLWTDVRLVGGLWTARRV